MSIEHTFTCLFFLEFALKTVQEESKKKGTVLLLSLGALWVEGSAGEGLADPCSMLIKSQIRVK